MLVDGVTEIGAVTSLAARIQHELAQPFSIDVATPSIGIVMMDSGYRRGEDLLRDADAAMYRAKEAGGARFRVFGTSVINSRTG